jgi:ribosomal-protein-alanine N-acetyltransferase
MRPIETPRLRLTPATAAAARADATRNPRLEHLVGARVPPDWPPPLLADALPRLADRLEADPGLTGWFMWYWALTEARDPPELIGVGGFKGRPGPDGTLEIGYSLREPAWHHGYATEAVTAHLDWAFRHPGVERVVADTLPDLDASIAVLERLGFRRLGRGPEPGTLRFALVKSAW